MSIQAATSSIHRLALALVVAALLPGSAAAAKPGHYPRGHHRPVCPAVPAREARCHAQIVTDAGGTPLTSTAPVSGAYAPGDLTSAYNLPGGGAAQTVAIVDAYNHPYAENDLAVYRQQYGLPACTTANGCFRKV